MDLPPLFYDGRNDPPHPEIWIGYFLRMMELYAKRVVEIAEEQAPDKSLASLSHVGLKECRFLEYLKKRKVAAFAPVEMAKAMKVSNRTIINWCAALAKVGLVEPEIIGKRIRAYKLT